MSKVIFTHIIKKSKQLCFGAAWWPSVDPAMGGREKAYPLMRLESGQITRVRASNLKKIPAGAV